MTTETAPPGKEIATLAGGCFWCLEAVFDRLQGVESVQSGYTGGKVVDPTYEQVCGGNTGHAEVVRVTFDPNVIAFRELLGVFFATHDPTTSNRQGNDIGTQYRSAVFYHTPAQKTAAEQLIAEFNREKTFGAPVVTEVTPAPAFYAAERYHQRYFENNASQPYCQFVVAPKVAKLRKHFAERLKSR